jgi:tight adherence protein C
LFIILIIGLTFVAAAVALVIRAVTVQRSRAVAGLGQINSYGFTAAQTSKLPHSPAAQRSIDNLASAIGDAIARRFGTLREEDLQRRLIAAGIYRTNPRRFLGYQVLSTILVPLFLAWLLGVTGASAMQLVFAVLGGAVAGWILPSSYLSKRARKRLEQVDYNLPELIDLLVVTVEAGLGFTGSLRVAADRLTGTLGDEIRLTLQEQSFGLSTVEALESLGRRCDTPAVRSFVRAITQGERLGVSIGQILRNLALEMRKRRRQSAEERAQKAPIKILFPLVFLIFPAMFVIILGPALYTLGEAFTGK